jgi:hypothetical protein
MCGWVSEPSIQSANVAGTSADDSLILPLQLSEWVAGPTALKSVKIYELLMLLV